MNKWPINGIQLSENFNNMSPANAYSKIKNTYLSGWCNKLQSINLI